MFGDSKISNNVCYNTREKSKDRKKKTLVLLPKQL